MKKSTFLLIDANSLIHRAYHALPPLSTSKGVMTNAVYGFLAVLFRAIKETKPRYIAATFDSAGPTKRAELFAEYKATRQKAPDELYQQIPLIQEALSIFHIPFFEKPSVEADDLIGTIALTVKEKEKEVETIILSGDLDTLQLVDSATKVYSMRRGIQDSVLYDEKGVKERFGGLTPEQLVDYKGLAGDASDNIPGVRGIGEKTAINLLSEYGSLERLYETVEKELPKGISPRIASLLKDQKDQAFLSRELAQIERDVPMQFAIQDFAWEGYDKEQAKRFLQSMEFHSLVVRLPGEEQKEAALFEKESTEDRIARLEQDGVLSKQIAELERDLVPVLKSMEAAGIKIDIEAFQKLAEGLTTELRKAESEIFEMAGFVFNIGSPKQLSEVLFEAIGLPQKGLKKTPGGVVSTASAELEKLRHPIVEKILLYRELAKLHTTYVVPLPALADKQGRIHTTFDQLGTATGRLSSSNPNIQNIPLQGTWGKEVRRGFIAEQGFSLLALDYSQMELRIAAHMTQDQTMQQVFIDGKDIHAATAAEVFGVPLNQVTSEMRYRAKALNFGVLYGMGARGFSQASGISVDEASLFIESYFARFPNIQAYVEGVKAFARDKGYVETIWGRRRYLPDIHSRTPHIRASAERMAINMPIQGTAADIIKKAMVEIARKLKGTEIRMLLQIHDELLFELPDDILNQIIPALSGIMEEVSPLSVPLTVQAKVGGNWSEMEPFAS